MSAWAVACPGELSFDPAPSGELVAYCSAGWSAVELGITTPPSLEQAAVYAWWVVGAWAAVWAIRLLWRSRIGLNGGDS